MDGRWEGLQGRVPSGPTTGRSTPASTQAAARSRSRNAALPEARSKGIPAAKLACTQGQGRKGGAQAPHRVVVGAGGGVVVHQAPTCWRCHACWPARRGRLHRAGQPPHQAPQQRGARPMPLANADVPKMAATTPSQHRHGCSHPPLHSQPNDPSHQPPLSQSPSTQPPPCPPPFPYKLCRLRPAAPSLDSGE